MIPAHQCFNTLHQSGFWLNLRLVIQNELVFGYGVSQFTFDGDALVDFRIHVFFKENILIAAFFLGAVHGDIGVTHQVGNRLAILRVNGDTDTGGQHIFFAVENKGFAQNGNDFLGDRLRGLLRIQLADDDSKFVAAKPRHRVAFINAAVQPFPGFTQQFIANRMPVTVIDHFKPVQIDIQHSQSAFTTLILRNFLLQLFHEKKTVRQFRQRVNTRLPE